MKNLLKNLFLITSIVVLSSCTTTPPSSSSSSEESVSSAPSSEEQSSPSSDSSEDTSVSVDPTYQDPIIPEKVREDRNMSKAQTIPANVITEEKFVKSRHADITQVNNDFFMKSTDYNLKFVLIHDIPFAMALGSFPLS